MKNIDKIAKSLFGISKTFALKNQICVMCHGTAKDFKDELSKKEYKISGLCQCCQDQYFNV